MKVYYDEKKNNIIIITNYGTRTELNGEISKKTLLYILEETTDFEEIMERKCTKK